MHTFAVHYPDYSTIRTKRFYSFHVLTCFKENIGSTSCNNPIFTKHRIAKY